MLSSWLMRDTPGLRLLTRALASLAILACGSLLVASLAPDALAGFGHAPLSAAPLLLIGAAYMVLQGILRPPWKELVKRLLLGLAFVLWGVDQLLPSGPFATVVGDVVIILFVVDLGLITLAHLRVDDRDTP